MPNEPEITTEQLRDLLDLLKRTIEGGAELARRIELLEEGHRETVSALAEMARIIQAMHAQMRGGPNSGESNMIN